MRCSSNIHPLFWLTFGSLLTACSSASSGSSPTQPNACGGIVTFSVVLDASPEAWPGIDAEDPRSLCFGPCMTSVPARPECCVAEFFDCEAGVTDGASTPVSCAIEHVCE